MKIDRVLLVSSNNKVYYDFWNPLSKVYKEKFNIQPTLIWVGTEQEKIDCGISDEYGDIIVVNPNKNYHVPSQCYWATFWATQFFKDEVCFICGIDEVPLSGMFLKDIVNEYTEDDYVMLIADAYLPDHWTVEASSSPSGQHISKGSNFMKIYNFEESFEEEIEKVFKSGAHEAYIRRNPNGYWPVILEHPYWGIDECYYSQVLRSYRGDVKIQSLSHFGLMRERRIDCMRDLQVPYDLQKLQEGWYSQAHLCRPFDRHKDYILTLFKNIPDIK
jgi:hypothetical protein